MGQVREFERADVPAVVKLHERVIRSGSTQPPPGLADLFERTFLDHPWVDDEIPSLVYEDDGRIVGFIGAHVRRFRIEGQPVRALFSGQFVTDPDARNSYVGVLLMRQVLAGTQDVAMTDGASASVRQMWEGLGGRTVDLQSIGWLRLFRPWRFAGDQLLETIGAVGLAPITRPLWSILDGLTARIPGIGLRPTPSDATSETLSPETLLEHRDAILGDVRVRADYDVTFLRWMFAEMEGLQSRGPLVRELVRGKGSKPLGWWVAFLPSGGLGQVMQVAAGRSHIAQVVDHLFHTAERRGVAALHGRMESHLSEVLATRRCLLRRTARPLVHARNSHFMDAIIAGPSALSRMDGEWWMGHWTEFR